MNLQKQGIATIGLIFITFLAAIQYVFLRNVPDNVSTFAFICITNVIGVIVLGAVQIKKLLTLSKQSLLKGILLALELTGFNFFLLLGSRNLDAVVISSVVSLYFVFITPLLLLLKKKVNFFSGIASVIAIIALVLMFGADPEALFSSVDVVYLVLADIFFAAYVVSVSILGENEDSTHLTFSQMLFSALFALIGWGIGCAFFGYSFSLPNEGDFWVSALFIGVMIRAVYGLIQITSQKHVSALKASLIFSTEIVITLVMNPFLCNLLHMDYVPVTGFQIAGAALLILANLMVDDKVMYKLGYEDLQEVTYTAADGQTVQRSSVARKVILTTLAFSLLTLILSTFTFLSAIQFIRFSAVRSSEELGESASITSSEAMMQKLEESILAQAQDKALLAEQKLAAYSDSILFAASYANSLFQGAEEYPVREVERPLRENAGKWVMQRTLANPRISYEDVRDENCLLGNMQDVFEPIVKNNDNVATIYLGTESGLLISYDPNSDSGELEGESYYEYRGNGWYNDARNTDSYLFTDTYQDGYGRGLTITCTAPVRDASGHFLGCVAIDILMDELNSSMVNDGIITPVVAVLIDDTGNYIAGKNVDSLSENMGNIFDEGEDPSLRQAGKEILARKDGVVAVGEGEDAEYIAFSRIDSTGWILCIKSPVTTVIQPAIAIRDSIDQNTSNVVSSVMEGIKTVIQYCLLESALLLLLVTIFAGRYSRRISDPLKKLEKDVRQISEGNLDNRTDVFTDDEIGSLANSFNYMTDSLQQYIADLKTVTAKEERIAGELATAKNIQASMLPRDFDGFSDHRRFELAASMDPAKEVGGDFYDFFWVDKDHIALVMADVSGKGVPAALFMVIAKTLIKNRTLMGGNPGAILEDVNNQLCEGNEAELFVTVWLAIIDLSTGKGLAANAGHEHPALMCCDGQYQLVIYRHSPVMAAMEGIPFRDHSFELHPGDKLFVYTDGVPEATDAQEKLFGTDRMLEALNQDPGASPKETLVNVRRSIDAFVRDAEQFDDLTMLCLQYKGGGEKAVKELNIEAKKENLADVLSFVDGELEALDCPMKTQMQIDLAVEEIFINIASYAYAPDTGSALIRLEICEDPRAVRISFIDSGVPYNPLAKPDPNVNLSLEERQIGGLGIFMVKKSMDDMEYEYTDGQNILHITKRLG